MAHLWTHDAAGAWASTPIAAAAVLRGDGTITPADADPPSPFTAASGIQVRRVVGQPDTWALLTASRAFRLNGVPVSLGLAVLEDRDEIRLPGVHVWFSTETQAHVEPFPQSATRGFCPRCKQAIEAGSPAVRCPSCGLWHHASDDLPCWTYAPTCAACAQDTDLDAGFRWTPEDL